MAQSTDLGIVFLPGGICPRLAEKFEGMMQPSRMVELGVFLRMDVNVFPILNGRLRNFPDGVINRNNRVFLMRPNSGIALAMLQIPACIPQVG
jgi:hypothetical protein